MDHKEVGRMWDKNADTWTRLAREGYDTFRDHVNTPAFLDMLPEVEGMSGLDIGCGEGHNTRLLARLGARMTALDISKSFITYASNAEKENSDGIDYLLASAVELPFPTETFDFAVAFMSLMDLPEHEKALGEAYRVLKPGGFLQFSITHPCFQTPRWNWICDENGNEVALECGDYFFPPKEEVEEWMFGDLPPDIKADAGAFRVPIFRRTLSGWLNLLLEIGFSIEQLSEPFADEESVKRHPRLAMTRTIAFFLIIRCRKPL